MPSINIRQGVPKNLVVIQSNSTKPTGWTNETSLFGKFVRGTSAVCVCPGASEGASTHTHSSDGDHTHIGTGSHLHTHTKTTGGVSGGSNSLACSPDNAKQLLSHTHVVTSTNVCSQVTGALGGAHVHASNSNDPVHKTQFFLKNTGSVGMRRKSLGFNSIFMWGKPISCLPSRFSKDTNFNCQHIKGVATACSTPNQSGGSNTHTHDATPAHTHQVTICSHAHSQSGNTSVYSITGSFAFCGLGTGTLYGGSHSHGTSTVSFTSTICTTSSTSGAQAGAQTHPSLNHEPTYKEIAFVKHTKVGLRERGMVPGAMGIWVCPLSCLPSCWQVGDGTNGTFDMRGKYPKGVSGCSPGTTGGSNTHQHSNPTGTHTHASATINTHKHTMSGSVANYTATADTSTGSTSSNHTHNHPTSGCSDNSSAISASLDGAAAPHTHDCLNHQPPTIVVSFIERLKP